MSIPLVLTQAVPSRTGIRLMARVRGFGGALVTQASISTLTAVVTDLSAANAQISSTALTIASVWFDSLQWDLTWQKDGPNNPAPPPPFGDGAYGYNFAWVAPASNFANTGHRFQVDVKLVPVSGEQFEIAYQIPTFPVYA
jgi:hypothetical protein